MIRQELINKYPKIFDGSAHRTNISVPDAWISLVDSMCQEIQDYCDNNDIEQVICEQMKEKFGGLRFYTNSASDEIYNIISKYENKSRKICQECGCEDCKVYNTKGSWIRFICELCAIKLNKEIYEITNV